VLINAFAFSPDRGSEAAVGWNIATRLARDADVTVLYGDVRGDRRGEAEVANHAAQHGLPAGINAVYVAPSPLMALLERLHSLPASWMLYYLAYRLWQKSALDKARLLHANQAFDVVHQLTYIGYREPGDLWRLGIPFVWGPVSGAENIPAAFYRTFRPAEIFRPLSRDFGNHIQAAFPGRIRAAARAAAKVFAVSSSEETLFARWGVACERMLETGTTPKPFARVRGDNQTPLRIVWSGVFTARKAFPILVQALKILNVDANQWSLTVLGDGPLAGLWRAEYERAGLPQENVEWKGRVSHEQAIKAMSQGDLLVHTGLREGTPHVVLEALSLGMPVICHDAGGMGTAINDSCGVRVPLRDFNCSVANFSVALRLLLSDPSLLQRLSSGALDRAAELSWEAISERLLQTYQDVTSSD